MYLLNGLIIIFLLLFSELPKLPEVEYITHNVYETIYLALVPFPNDLIEYNTTIKTYKLDQGNVTLLNAVY